MPSIQIFDPALCCSSGVCGTDVDQPLAFAEQAAVKQFLERSGQEGLPLILVDGEIALAGRYPRRAELACWAGISGIDVVVQPATGACSGPGRQ